MPTHTNTRGVLISQAIYCGILQDTKTRYPRLRIPGDTSWYHLIVESHAIYSRILKDTKTQNTRLRIPDDTSCSDQYHRPDDTSWEHIVESHFGYCRILYDTKTQYPNWDTETYHELTCHAHLPMVSSGILNGIPTAVRCVHLLQ